MSTLRSVTKLWQSMVAKGNYNAIFAPIEVVSADDHCLKCRFQVRKEQTNSLNILHGGYTSGVIDFVSSVDLLRRGIQRSVSVDLATSFMKAAPAGASISVESYVMRQGKSLAFCEVSLLDETTGKLIAKGRQTKFVLPATSPSLSNSEPTK